MRNFLVFGGSQLQLPAIQRTQALGMKVVVIDRDPTCIGAKVADYFECVDTTDFSGAEQVARHYNVVGSMTMSNDLAVPTSCYVNERLNLPLQGQGLTDLITDKYSMRQKYAAHQVNSPRFYQISDSDNLAFIKHQLQSALKTKSFIVKPNDSSGSRGVSKMTNIDELDEAVQYAMSFSPSRKVIVEEFIDGIELGALTFSVDGKMVYCFAHNDKVSQMVQVGHSFPHLFSSDQEIRIQNECEKALSSLGIKNGPCLLDIILDSNDIPFIIEAGARLSAHKLPDIVKIHSGIDLVTLTVQLASGQKVECPSVTKNEAVAVEMLYFNHDGIVEKIGDLSSLVQKYQPIDFALRILEKQKITKLKSSQDHYGYVIFTGKNVVEAEKKCTQFIEECQSLLDIRRHINEGNVEIQVL
ncbi:ATP-grasp domain-containing protein [Bacillus sp. FJAT-52991]|uniref:ATP-grasp domain-containing protein n=1 Tax=Bacillus kandeliae TaxID=3129297 RepID=A0ABZ2N6A4_9BACI